jgi:outer membrane protein, adhesin transport system
VNYSPALRASRLFTTARRVWLLPLCWALSAAVHAQGPLGVAELTQATLSQHPSLRASAARETAAQMGVDAARWQFWPTPRLGLEHVQGSGSDGTGSGRTVGVLRVEQPLWTGGRLTAGLQKAESGVSVAEAETQEARQQLAARVVQAWSEVMAAERKLYAQRLSLQRHEALLQMVQRRLANGVSAESDAALARSRIEVLESEILLLQAQRDAALDRLRLLSGRPLATTDLTLSHRLPDIAAVALDELVARAARVSPQLLKSRHGVEVAQADKTLAQAGLLPEVSLRFEHQQGSASGASSSSASRVFISLNSTLGAGLSSWSGVDAAVARLLAAQEDIALQTQLLTEQVQSDLTLLRAAQARLRGLRAAVQASADVLESYERQFLAGRKQWLDLMNAAREQAQSESQLADAQAALELSGLRLVLWTGGVDALLQVPTQVIDLRAAR